MRIECPDCAAAYEVPAPLLAARKTVRCARCGGEWTPELAAAPPTESSAAEPISIEVTPAERPEPLVTLEPPAVETPLPVRRAVPPSLDRPSVSAMQRLAQPATPPPRSGWPLLGWVLSVLVLAALVWAGFAWRDEIMQAWPPSTRLYAALGLAPVAR